MPSSTLVACRALIMLGSLIALPAAALFWPSFPAAVDRVMAGVGQQRPQNGVTTGPLTRVHPDVLAEAPRFEAGRARGPLAFAQTAAEGSPAQPLAGREHPRLIPLPGPTDRHLPPQPPLDSRTVPAGYVQPNELARNSVPQRANAAGVPGRLETENRPGALAPRAVPAGIEPTSMRQNPLLAPDNPAARTNAAGQPLPRATFQELQVALRRRGVTYSLLETLGDEGDQYRFHCNVAVAGNARYTRPFEASSRDPITAMEQVLGQIEAWQSGRRP